MAATLCHGLQSPYLESRMQYRHMLLPFEPNSKSTGWSSIQALSSVEKESTISRYEVKQSLVRLSAKSLELCTENLGNETGSDVMTESDVEFLSSCSWEGRSCRKEEKKKVREARHFPPPLTTIRGSHSIQMKPHREGGRLVLQLTKTKLNLPSSFHAQRTPGRLRLCFSNNIHHDHVQRDVKHQHVDAENDEHPHDAENYEHPHDAENYEHQHQHQYTSWSVSRRSRCNETDHENKDLLLNWGEPFCVAIS
ncbi:hypothetical protein Fmac_003510 [Flemingia macrophylla]|uniref:FAF domain-containing protein n=1 Tax=Flemingia macrophylla TaxID=520843 RepID=A0ABD1NMZ7_9FABA